MNEQEWLVERFEEQRRHLRGVAYRMLGSLSEADDAVQESWVRMSRADAAAVENVTGWMTTIVARVCLNMLRSRRTHPAEPLDVHVPDPVISTPAGVGPEESALLADSVGLALLVVLETLDPAERIAFVLHDLFGIPFDEIAPVVGRSSAAARQLASRARRRVQGSPTVPDADVARQREVVDAFFAAARDGDFDALVAVLDPGVVLRSDGGAAGHSSLVRGPAAVAGQALQFSSRHPYLRRALVNGAAGVVIAPGGTPVSVMAFTVAGGKIVRIDVLADPDRLRRLDIPPLG